MLYFGITYHNMMQFVMNVIFFLLLHILQKKKYDRLWLAVQHLCINESSKIQLNLVIK